mmetsp:Transcript_10454/g.23012  ORF Transcript_10454/g.23012 Transcript_10454/m.23012 type:complete len:343 (-) Transcript_10454:199-1227(-)
MASRRVSRLVTPTPPSFFCTESSSEADQSGLLSESRPRRAERRSAREGPSGSSRPQALSMWRRMAASVSRAKAFCPAFRSFAFRSSRYSSSVATSSTPIAASFLSARSRSWGVHVGRAAQRTSHRNLRDGLASPPSIPSDAWKSGLAKASCARSWNCCSVSSLKVCTPDCRRSRVSSPLASTSASLHTLVMPTLASFFSATTRSFGSHMGRASQRTSLSLRRSRASGPRVSPSWPSNVAWSSRVLLCVGDGAGQKSSSASSAGQRSSSSSGGGVPIWKSGVCGVGGHLGRASGSSRKPRSRSRPGPGRPRTSPWASASQGSPTSGSHSSGPHSASEDADRGE